MSRPLDRVATHRAGVLGAQIAMLAANAGYTTKIYDPVAGAFENTYTKIWNDLKAKGVTPAHRLGEVGGGQEGRQAGGLDRRGREGRPTHH